MNAFSGINEMRDDLNSKINQHIQSVYAFIDNDLKGFVRRVLQDAPCLNSIVADMSEKQILGLIIELNQAYEQKVGQRKSAPLRYLLSV